MANFTDIIGAGGPTGNAVPPPPQVNFNQIVPPQQGLEQSPPKSPEELAQRQQGWADFIKHIQTDPVARNTLLMVGATMMQDPHMGESGAGVLGRALQVGGLSAQAGRAREFQQKRDLESSQRASAMSDAQIAQMALSGDRTRQQMEFEGQRQPLEIQGAELGLKGKQFQVENQGRMLEDSLATSASQREFNRARAQRQAAIGGGGGGQKMDDLERWHRMANPDASDEEIGQFILKSKEKAPKESKEGLSDSALSNLAISGDPDDPLVMNARKALMQKMDGAKEAPEAPKEQAKRAKQVDEKAFRAAMKTADKNGFFIFEGTKYQINKEASK